MKRSAAICFLTLVLEMQPARAELLQLDLSIFGMD